MSLRVRRLDPNAQIPQRAHPTDVGYDLAACLDAPRTVHPGEVVVVPTGIALEVPPGVAGLVVPRSSAGRRGLRLANTVGVIDPGYRGEVLLALEATRGEAVVVEPGDRLAQLLLVPVLLPSVVGVDHLEPSDRGEGGWGSTGR